MGGSPGLVVLGGDSCSKGHWFKSQSWILDGHVSHLIVVEIVMFNWTDENKWKRGRGWTIFKTKHYVITGAVRFTNELERINVFPNIKSHLVRSCFYFMLDRLKRGPFVGNSSLEIHLDGVVRTLITRDVGSTRGRTWASSWRTIFLYFIKSR